MSVKRNLFVMAGIVFILFLGCQTVPEGLESQTDTEKIVSGAFPQGVKDFMMNAAEDVILGIGASPNETQRKIYAHREIARQLIIKTRETYVNFNSPNLDQSNLFQIYLSASLSASELSAWLKENNILPESEYHEGEWYAVAYKIPQDILKFYPRPVMPVVTLFSIEDAVIYAAENVSDRLPTGSKIAIVNISAPDPDDAEFVLEELSTELVKASNDGGKEYTMVDRRSLDVIRQENEFQLGGDVSDDTIVSIGKLLGADVVITGSITGANEYRRLRIKALDARTARLLIQTNMKY